MVVVVETLTVPLDEQLRQLEVPRVRDVDVRVLGVRQVVGLVIQSDALFGREQEDRGSTSSRVSTVAAYAQDGDAVLESFVHTGPSPGGAAPLPCARHVHREAARDTQTGRTKGRTGKAL